MPYLIHPSPILLLLSILAGFLFVISFYDPRVRPKLRVPQLRLSGIMFLLVIFLAGMLSACRMGDRADMITVVPQVPDGTATIPVPVATNTPAEIGAEATPSPESKPVSPPKSIETFFNDSYRELQLRNPELISELGLSEAYGVEDEGWTEVSLEYEEETIALAEAQLDILHTWDFDALSPEEQISYRVYEWYLQDMVDGEAYLLYNYPYNHLFGWPSAWADFMMNTHPLATEGDIQGYIHRLETFNLKAEQMVAFIEAQRALGIEPPRKMLEYALSQAQSYTHPPAGDHILLTTLQDRIAGLQSITQDQKDEFMTQAEAAISNGALVGYQNLAQILEGWLAEVDNDLGLGAQPGGVDAYTYMLRHHTTTAMTAEEIHQLGLDEVARITEEMEAGFTALGISGDTMADKIGQVAVVSGFVQGQDAVVDTYTQILAQVEIDFAGYFDLWPETEMEVIAFNSPTSPGAYYTYPALDGSHPGRFFVNVGGGQYAYNMPTLAYHEGMPGHHYQIALQQEIEGLPHFRNGVNFTAYAEGWALYAEYVAWEAGIYEENPYGNIGRLQGELFRAARLVVDTGIHALGWSRDEAIQYMMDTLGWQRQGVVAEVDRYFAWPGQATAYKVGMLKILEIRQHAMEALGDDFDIVEFHRLVVGNGAMPLEVLELVVEQWIEEKR